MGDFIEQFFMTDEGDIITRSSEGCMDYLQNNLGWSLAVARGILGLAVAKGFIKVVAVYPEKLYGL